MGQELTPVCFDTGIKEGNVDVCPILSQVSDIEYEVGQTQGMVDIRTVYSPKRV
jgi:hypothetical protein